MSRNFILVLFFFTLKIGAQTKQAPPLERIITISAENKTVESILDDISTQAGFVFSYSPDAIKHADLKTIHASNKPVRLVLYDMFENSISYKVRGKYIILRKTDLKKETDETSKKLEGYVYDSRTGEKLTGASIYDKTLLASAVTDQYGYFSMEIPANKSITTLRVSKNGYSDTTFLSTALDQRIKTLELTTNSQETVKVNHPFFNLPDITPKWLIPDKIKLNSININDTLLRAVQVSFIPGLSTNRLLGGNAYNDISLNILGGYVQGVNYAEFGGILNIVRENASYCQISGVGNIVGGEFKGVQYAGTFNYASSAYGIQTAGIANVVYNKATIQIAGIVNHATENKAQLAGIINNSYKADIQIAGIVNRSAESFIQVAGIGNISKKIRDVQIGGIFNHSFETGQLQIAGLVNNSEESSGIQIAAILNRAKNVYGYQIGLVNFSDSCSGVPIGLFSFIKSGYHKLEISADEIFQANVAFRTGVRIFHTYIGTGFSVFNKTNPVLNLGYGVGTSFGGNEKYQFDADISSQNVINRNTFSFEGNLYKIYFGIDRKLKGKSSLAAGITFNFLFTDMQSKYYNEVFSKTTPYSITNTDLISGNNLKTWIGAKIALRLF